MWWKKRIDQSHDKWMQQISTERVKDLTWLGGQGYSVGIVQETEVWPYEQIVDAQPRICPREWDTNSSKILRYKRITKSRPDDQIL